jgi:predicted CopG family antitoxin
MIEQTQQNNPATKTLIVSADIHRALSLMKIEGEYKSMDTLITYLLGLAKKNKIVVQTTKRKNGKTD